MRLQDIGVLLLVGMSFASGHAQLLVVPYKIDAFFFAFALLYSLRCIVCIPYEVARCCSITV